MDGCMKEPSRGESIAYCIRRMKSDDPYEMLSAVLALKRVLSARGKDLDKLADRITSWAIYERDLAAGAEDVHEDIFDAAMKAEAQAEVDAQAALTAQRDVADKTVENSAPCDVTVS